MQPVDVSRAIAAAMSIASAHGLTVDDAVVLQNSNKLTVHLLPCDALARIAPLAQQVAQFEVDLARQLAETGSPAVALEHRVPPHVFERDGFLVTFWSYHPSVTPRITSTDYADALGRLHVGMRKIDHKTPHFTDRIAEAERLLASHHRTPNLADVDRAFLSGMLKSLKSSIIERGAAEQLLHGEPHPGNVLSTKFGPLFIDLETCCHGPIEFDLAHVPEAVIEHYPGVDAMLLGECRALVLVMVAAWRWDAEDQFPDGRRWAEQFIRTLRKGAPWPSLDEMTLHL
ncbi:MAG: aminoglycoside phosphotransferase family protein [Rhizobiaceae bacterium]